MATGILGHEKLSADSLSAALPHKDPHPLPSDAVAPSLVYPNRLTKAEVLSPLYASFIQVDTDGRTAPIQQVSNNSLILADNLFGLHGLLESKRKATLIYLDPPYNTGMEFQSRQLEHAYSDQLGFAAYLEFMRRRLILMRELLTDDGSIYVHIGHQMVSHLKVIMDEIFGQNNFRNIITRRKCSSKNFTKHQYSNLNDFILFYSKSPAYKWNQPGQTPDEDWIQKEYPKVDKRGRYKLVPIHAPGTRRGETGEIWRGMLPPPGKHWQYVPTKLEEFDKAGEIHWSRNGNPRRKVYLTQDKLVSYTDYGDCFRDAHHQSIAVTGYPTEKNLAMLRMIVSASSNEGDLVIDPFCGSGTTMHAANDLRRSWIGIDQSFNAIKAAITRLRHGLEPMGDYVSREEDDQPHDRSNVLDMFAGLSSPTKDKNGPASKAKASDHQPALFSFVVDDELLEMYPEEIREMALI
ncbi:Modification methylase EcaI [Candidatus Methylobacter favarea]|uniref:site-specific DNA-methyltransferase (adenine-specific) n=1 Tax=Candidatus Methylobacter favarea TaxID=2707345 RepID=A0A8S0Y5P6_9GAMM|nr:site-specific DNA-methyltransferase [Candidatus Methylobacter favarea]CAA9889498.1 Modification methylase EcaI [Candidatus Methylobacter favarea]